jgi:hypothetical protein
VLKELKEEERRRDSVLVFRGTGFNIWHYLPFLRNFSLKELSQFRALYVVSGASLLLWLFCLIEQGIIAESVASHYDEAMRRGLNRYGLLRCSVRLLAGQYPYVAADFIPVFRELAPPSACEQTLGDLPLDRLRFVAQEESRRELLILMAREFPAFSVAEVISRAVAWGETFERPFCHRTPYNGLLIGDFDFSGRQVKEQFREHLRMEHPGYPIYQINLFRTLDNGLDRFVQVCYDRHPRAWQLIDSALFYLGIPNHRYYRTAQRHWTF